MSQSNRDVPRVTPAQVDFLAIYNPTFGTSDETLREQILYYYSRHAHKRQDRGNDATHEAEEDENQKLRQIGLAQGMVSFANDFSPTSNVDSIETEKSRIVLHELEKNWWILASIDLTVLPRSRPSREDTSGASVEYSAREVAPAQLLITQLARANSLFLLHHATKLQDLLERTGRPTFCALLEKYWDKFLRHWDVLLHGNPAVAIYDAVKLCGGGELGIGVGEEEWGSGEREVLEGFIDRTEGLRDLIVGRYGLPPDMERASNSIDAAKSPDIWLGTGNDSAAADGITFSGKGVISHRSLRVISKWMEDIFKYGDDAYGIRDNPVSRPRARRSRRKAERSDSAETSRNMRADEVHSKGRPLRKRASSLRKQAMENNASPPGVPPPLVSQVERSLDKALAGASGPSPSKSSTPDNPLQKSTASSNNTGQETSAAESMMKYLTLGYGTSWTLNPKGLKSEEDESTQRRLPSVAKSRQPNATDASSTEDQGMKEIEPAPDVSDDEKPFRQKLDHSMGKFLIGLSGDLEQTELDMDSEDDSENSESRSSRLFIRTLMVEMRQPRHEQRNPTIRTNSDGSAITTLSKCSGPKRPPTSAESSVDGPQPHTSHEKVRLAIYVHQPFMFVFLFDLHTANLTIPSFYRSIHNQLGPLQRPLLRSTDPTRTAERIAAAMGEKSTITSQSASSPSDNPIYDLIYDSSKNTVRTSIPNIPVPGSLAAEGLTGNTSSSLSVSGSWYTLGIPIGSTSSPSPSSSSLPAHLIKSAWSRTEALNVHTQILNTYLSTHTHTTTTTELEHTSKTSRGWWILWMKISPSQKPRDENDSDSETRRSRHKEAFLVRKAADHHRPGGAGMRSVSSGPGKWLLREQQRERETGTEARGVSEGVGVDARRWIEGLLSLTS